MCQYLNKHHTDQHQFDNVEIHMVDASDSPDQYLKMKELAYEKARIYKTSDIKKM